MERTMAVTAGAEGGRPARARRRTWRLPLVLVLLAIVPLFGGTVRLIELATDAQLTPDNDHVFITTPVPIVVHIVTSCVYAIAGALQFSTGLRQRRPGLHRRLGRSLVPLGLAAALSALWMTLLYPTPLGTGPVLFVARLLFSSAMTVCLVLGFAAIRRGEVRRHRAWMIRAYAVGLGAGTQIVTLGFGEALLGDAVLTHDLLMTAGWVINLAVAEWAIRRWGVSGRRVVPKLAAAP